MKHIATMTLMLTLGAAAVYAHEKPVKMSFSGNGAASPINLNQPNTSTAEENVAGNGTLGRFTFRNVTAIAASPSPERPALARTQLTFIFQEWLARAYFASKMGVY
jgi:hypothetical protein